MDLDAKLDKVRNYVNRYTINNGQAPTLWEVSNACGLNSKDEARELIQYLAKRGNFSVVSALW